MINVPMRCGRLYSLSLQYWTSSCPTFHENSRYETQLLVLERTSWTTKLEKACRFIFAKPCLKCLTFWFLKSRLNRKGFYSTQERHSSCFGRLRNIFKRVDSKC